MAKQEVTMENIQKAIDRSLGDKLGLGAERIRMLGGFMDIFSEGEAIYKSKIEAIRNTGLLLDEITDQEGGLIGRLSKITEDSFRFFGRIDEGIDAVGDLTKGLRSFSMTSQNAQSELVAQAAIFKKLGVEMSDFTAVIDSARLGFDMSAKSAAQLSRDIASIGNATGVGMREAMANFSKAQSSMAYDSGKLMENFKKLQLTSAQTGVSFDKLTSSFGDSMDSFEGSANKAGSLNAILGRSVFNSIDLLGKTEAERVETIIQGIKKNVDVRALGKNKFQLKAISQGLGLTPDETRRLLTGQMTVKEALAQQTKDDPRAIATKRMVQEMDKASKGLENFADILDGLRTAQGSGTVAFNTMMRGIAKTAASNVGLNVDSPAQIFELMQQQIKALAEAGQLGEFGTNIETLKLNLKKDYEALTKAKGKDERLAAAQKLFTNLTTEVAILQESVPSTPRKARTAGPESASTGGNLVTRATQADPTLSLVQLMGDLAPIMSNLTSLTAKKLGGDDVNFFADTKKVILMVGDRKFDAQLISTKIKKPAGSP